MNVTSARDFLNSYGALFSHPAVREMGWTPSDDDFGRVVEWALDRGDLMDCIATFDLQANCCTMTVTERDLSEEAAQTGAGSSVAATTFVSFDDQSLQIDGEDQEFSDATVRQAISKFNELAV